MLRSTIKIFALALLIACSACSKKTHLPTGTQSESTTYIEREIIKTVLDTVEVVVEIPAQSASIVTHDTVSRLETQFAESYAKWSGGLLTHELKNKTAPIRQDVVVPNTVKEKLVERTDTVTNTEYVYIDKPLTAWQRFKNTAFWWLVVALVITFLVIFRKPLTALLLNR